MDERDGVDHSGIYTQFPRSYIRQPGNQEQKGVELVSVIPDVRSIQILAGRGGKDRGPFVMGRDILSYQLIPHCPLAKAVPEE